jgi:DNA-binding CsgD family transcriptional regulator
MPTAHPVLAHWLQGATDVACVPRLVSADFTAWRNSEAYVLLKRRLGCTETLGIRLDSGTTTVEMLGFTSNRDFTDPEIRPAELLQAPTHQVAQWRQDPRIGTGVEERASELGLTLREIEVLRLLSEGLLASTIGARLAISPRPVHRHLSNIYSKLGTHDRLSTVMFAASRQLIPSPQQPELGSERCAV